jgi:chromosome partitioning protein
MTVTARVCSICSTEFELHFSYQMEERRELSTDGEARIRVYFFCSQQCLATSHRDCADGMVHCDACAKSFRVDLASQVLFTGGRRHYACSPECRARVLDGVRTIRLGELKDPSFLFATERGEPRASSSPPNAEAGLPGSHQGHAAIRAPLATAQRTLPLRLVRRPDHSPQVLAVFNHKGGTGKTTTAVHVAAGLAERGCRVLLVDSDGQGNVAVSLGLRVERTLYHVIVMGLPLTDAAIAARPCLDVLPANETLAAAELYLAGRRQRDSVLAERLAPARDAYDFVIIDCSPSLSLLNQNALVAADAVLCPVGCDYLSIVGMRQVLRTLKQVQRLLSHPVRLWGVLPTMMDSRARICHEALSTLREHFGEICLDPVRLATRVKEAPSQGQTLYEYAPSSGAAQDYLAVVERLLGTTTDRALKQQQRAGGVG